MWPSTSRFWWLSLPLLCGCRTDGRTSSSALRPYNAHLLRLTKWSSYVVLCTMPRERWTQTQSYSFWVSVRGTIKSPVSSPSAILQLENPSWEVHHDLQSKLIYFSFSKKASPTEGYFSDIIRENDECVIVITHLQFTSFYFFRSLSSASWPPSPTAPPNPRPKCPLPLLFLRQFPFHPTVNKP